MDPLNNSLKNVIQFILCIQDVCDEHRKCMEHLWQQEYAAYVNEWKPSQPEPKLIDLKDNEVKSDNASKYVQMNPDNKFRTESDLELVLADSLLEKARNIRTKNKKLVNGLVNRNLSTFCTDEVVTTSASCDLKQTSQKIETRKKLPQSKSDFMIGNHRSSVVPRSKSANIPFIPKNSLEIFCNNKSSIALSQKTSIVKCTNCASSKTSKDFAVISTKELDKLKNLQLNLPCSRNSKEKKIVLPSDASKNRNQHRTSSHPSSTEFLSLMKDKLDVISSEVKMKIWYPFLSSKSESYLTAYNCDSFTSIKKVYGILYSIQETMMWIDLLYLLETDICPNLVVDITDMNSLRVYSYLHSLYHPNLKRKPIILPIKQ